MKIEQWDLSRVTPYAGNPRINDSAVDSVAESIRVFGWRQPIVVDVDGVIIAGHTRALAASRLGVKKVPVLVARDMTKEQAAAYRLADNRTADFSEWDLSGLQRELGLVGDIDLSSFNFEELLCGLDSGNADCGDAETREDEAEALRAEWGVELGHMWGLGAHRILCGDSTKQECVSTLLDGEVPLLMVTDPPYGVEYDADWRNESLRANGSPSGGRAIGKVANDDRADWSPAWDLFQGDVAYVWHAPGENQAIVLASLQMSGFEARNQIIWAKQQLVIGRGHYHHQHEPCWYAVRKGKTAHWIGDRKQTTLWEIDKPQKSETGHSTQKPIECMAKAIRNHDSEFVYEPFSGSGTTIIACEQLGRKCRAIELEPKYVAIALQRWVDATGGTPERLA